MSKMLSVNIIELMKKSTDKIEKLEQQKTNLAKSCLQKGDELFEAKKELKELKEGIRNLKTYRPGYSGDMVYDDEKFSDQFCGDYVETEDLEKLLEGDK